MTGLNDLLQSLKTAAAGATPGPWKSDYCGDVFTLAEKEWCEGAAAKIFRNIASTPTGPDPGNGAYIALCSPENILALVQALEEARGLAELANIVSVWMHTSGLRLPAQVDEDSYKLGEKARAFLEKYFKSEDRE